MSIYIPRGKNSFNMKNKGFKEARSIRVAMAE